MKALTLALGLLLIACGDTTATLCAPDAGTPGENGDCAGCPAAACRYCTIPGAGTMYRTLCGGTDAGTCVADSCDGPEDCPGGQWCYSSEGSFCDAASPAHARSGVMIRCHADCECPGYAPRCLGYCSP